MKKIKGLLLFGILTLLGIGSSFAFVISTQYFGDNGELNNFQFANSCRNCNPVSYSINNSLSSFVGYGSSPDNYTFCVNGLNGLTLILKYNPLFNFIPGTCDSNYNVSLTNSVFIRLKGNSSSCFTGYSGVYGDCPSSDYHIFYVDNTYNPNIGIINDTIMDGITYKKGTVVGSVGSSYSLWFGNSYSVSGSVYTIEDGVLLGRYILPDSNYKNYNGIFVMRLENIGNFSESNSYQAIVIALTGDNYNYDIYNYVYSVYNCPSSSLSIFDCSFSYGGLLKPSGTSNSFSSYNGSLFTGEFSSNNPYSDLTYFLTSITSGTFRQNYTSLTIYNKLDNNILTLYRPVVAGNPTTPLTNGFSLLLEGGALNILDGFEVPGGNQSFPDPIFDGGVFDANTYLIEETLKCYITSGEVCNSPFTYESSENYVNNYSHQPRIWNSVSKTGQLTFNNSVDMLSQYCLNVNTIQYSFCSQLYLYEGFPITYYYNNGYFNYIIFGSGWQVNLGTLRSGQLGYAYCDGPFCDNFNQGLPEYIRQNTGNYSGYGFSGEFVSLDFFKNYFENGFFFQCPFSYSGSYFTIGSKLIDRLDKHDPLKPINCMIAGFSYGIKSSFFGDSKLGLSHTGVFMKNTGPNATRFYTFLDIILSLGYIFSFSKLFKFLKKH